VDAGVLFYYVVEGFTKPQLSVMSMVNRRETCQVLLIYSFDYT